MERALLAATACAIAATIGFIVWLAGNDATDLFTVLMLAWAGLPYALLALVPRIVRRTRAGAGAAPALVCTIAAFGLAVFVAVQTFFVDPDPQGPIVVLFLPFLQLLAVPVAFLVTLLAAKRPLS